MEGLLFLCHISPKETETTSSLSVSTNANAQCVANKSGISTLICQVGLKETHLPEPQKQELHWEPVWFFFRMSHCRNYCFWCRPEESWWWNHDWEKMSPVPRRIPNRCHISSYNGSFKINSDENWTQWLLKQIIFLVTSEKLAQRIFLETLSRSSLEQQYRLSDCHNRKKPPEVQKTSMKGSVFRENDQNQSYCWYPINLILAMNKMTKKEAWWPSNLSVTSKLVC